RQRPGHVVAVLQQADDGAFGMHVDALVDAVVLQGADQLEAGAVADVGESRVAVPSEVALEDAAVGGAVEDGSPRLQLTDGGGGPRGRAWGPGGSFGRPPRRAGCGRGGRPFSRARPFCPGRGGPPPRPWRGALSQAPLAPPPRPPRPRRLFRGPPPPPPRPP